MEAEQLHADGRTHRNDDANNIFSQYTNAPKKQSVKAVQGNNRCLFSDPQKIHKYSLLAEQSFMAIM
jgi:hypothetical protein